MAITPKPLLDKLIVARSRRPFGQFGTTDDESTGNGARGCTHACWRFIIWAYKGKLYSQDQISKLAGYPASGATRGMRVNESQNLVRALGLPYVYKAGLTSGQLLAASNLGPVLFGERYGYHPSWKGYKGHYQAPYSRPLGKSGRNQFDWGGSHAAVLLGYIRVPTTGTFVRNDCYCFEPNHDSAARPENVPHDLITQSQLNKAYQGLRTLGWTQTMAFVPTKAPTFPGGL